MSSLTIFGSAGEEALQGHSKVLAILHRCAKRAILTRVNNIFRGLLQIRINYQVSDLHRTPFIDSVGDAGAGRGGQFLMLSSLWQSRRQEVPPSPCAVQLVQLWRQQVYSAGSTNSCGCAGRQAMGSWSGGAGPTCSAGEGVELYRSLLSLVRRCGIDLQCR